MSHAQNDRYNEQRREAIRENIRAFFGNKAEDLIKYIEGKEWFPLFLNQEND